MMSSANSVLGTPILTSIGQSHVQLAKGAAVAISSERIAHHMLQVMLTCPGDDQEHARIEMLIWHLEALQRGVHPAPKIGGCGAHG